MTEATGDLLQGLCIAVTSSLPAADAAVSLMTGRDGGGGPAAASSRVAWRLEELQFGLGEGPGLEAFSSRQPVLEPDLGNDGMSRWPGYGPAAHEHGIRAVFAFPLQAGAARLGALDIFRTEPGPLSPSALSRAVTFAEQAMDLLVDDPDRDARDRDESHSGRPAPRGHQHRDPARRDLAHRGRPHRGRAGGREATDPDIVHDVLSHRFEVYQAQGMVMVDLGVGLTEAMARLRGHAFAEGRQLLDVARDVVAGRLVLDRDSI